jgi:transposase InsO family protein
MNVPAERTVQALREAFQRWGRPDRLRVDNGHPWGSTGDLPTELELWLMGLGIEMVHNPPARPQANGVVERSQEIGQRWSDASRRGSAAEVEAALEAMDEHQREGFPEPARSRLRLFPKLAHSGRSYAVADELALWSETEMRRRLSEYAVVRQIVAVHRCGPTPVQCV